MSRPNIIFIISDQLRYSALACNGNPVIQTPNLDKLAAEGISFDQAFASCPICSAYRGQVLTGKYAHVNGCIDNEYKLYPDQETLPRVLGQAGYKTAWIGKWHLGYGPYTQEKRQGFDYMAAYNCIHEHNGITYHINEQGPFDMDSWGPICETDLALQFVENHQGADEAEPFCVVMSWGPPHWNGHTYKGYPEQFNLYKPDAVDLPPNVPVQMAAFAREEIAHYYGNVSALDHELGRIMAYLKENDLEDNTILCFTADHGDHLSSHGYGKPFDMWLHPTKRASKATPHEEAIHIPFILRYPAKVTPGQRSETMFSSVDVMPTLLKLADVDIPDGIQGHDLSHAVFGEAGTEPDSVYLQILGPGWPHRGDWVGFWRGVRTPRWTYARWFDRDETWLFDRDSDPYELNNLAGNPEHSEIQAQLEQRLQRWIRDSRDPFETGPRDPDTGILQLGQEFTHPKWEI